MEGITMCWGYTEILIILRQHKYLYYTSLHASTFKRPCSGLLTD